MSVNILGKLQGKINFLKKQHLVVKQVPLLLKYIYMFNSTFLFVLKQTVSSNCYLCHMESNFLAILPIYTLHTVYIFPDLLLIFFLSHIDILQVLV